MNTYPRKGFIESIIMAFKNYVNCSGRARRHEFWYFQLFIFLIYVILEILNRTIEFKILFSYNIYSKDSKNELINYNHIYSIIYKKERVYIKITIIDIVQFIFIILTFIPNISLIIRRLHDTGKSWFYVLFILIPIIGYIIIICLCSCDSDKNDNIYGLKTKYYNPPIIMNDDLENSLYQDNMEDIQKDKSQKQKIEMYILNE